MNAMLQDLDAKLKQAVRDLDVTQTQVAPFFKWNIQQIVEHLNLSYASTAELIRGRILKRRTTNAKSTLPQMCQRLLIINLGYFPGGVAAPETVTPSAGIPLCGEEIGLRYSERLREMDNLLAEASSLFGSTRPVASHLILGPLSVAQWRRFHVVHGLHHLKQIKVLRRGVSRAAPIRPAADLPHR